MAYSGPQVRGLASLPDPAVGLAVRSAANKGPRVVPLSPEAEAIIVRRMADGASTIFARPATGPSDTDRHALAAIEGAGKRRRQREPKFLLVTPHGVRHLVADRLRDEGVDPIVAARLLGHSTIQRLAHYSHEGIDELREAVGRLGR